jgi:hypothetical protein
MERKATTTTPDPELSMPLDMGTETARQDQGAPPTDNGRSPQAGEEQRQDQAAGQAPRRGAQA